ncbi:MAG: DUF2309 domain-containing protein [Bacteroidetes bacterium]|nr:DUF2309 domain-containing protein [Bacteroidota bacterium]
MHDSKGFDEHHLLHNLKHYLPAQAPLKDFVHHNTLHEFQDQKFHDGLAMASKMLGYKVYLSLNEYRNLYNAGKINPEILKQTISRIKGPDQVEGYLKKLFQPGHNQQLQKRIGALRAHWKDQYHFDLNGRVHVNVFRILNSYLDQGVALWPFPIHHMTLLEAIRHLEKNSFSGFFRTDRARVLLHDQKTTIKELLKILVGEESLFEQYVFDQQFEHPGWSGLVAVIEEQPQTLLDQRKISLHDLILLELMLEIDTMDHRFGANWKPLAHTLKQRPTALFSDFEKTELDDLYAIWQEAYEWSYYDDVIKGLLTERELPDAKNGISFQAFFCIDDREISLREYIENLDPNCQTFGTPGHFAIDTYYQPQHGKFHTKICPLPVTPKHLICEESDQGKHKKDVHFNKRAHNLFSGWIIAQTVGFWSAFKLFINVFKPSISPASASSFRHMDQFSSLTVVNADPKNKIDGLQVGYSVPEMIDRVETVLKSTGLVTNFAPLIYVIGHGASSTNNTHFAAYDCGACSGRPGSVNARVFSIMANHPDVRSGLAARGISIPEKSKFLGGLHDTTCDDFHFYDVEHLSTELQSIHEKNTVVFSRALNLNAKERSRRFDLVNTKRDAADVHKRVRLRSVSLFEPRPEYNHATNTLCVIGRRELTQKLCLDRRSFLNSYDPTIDPEGRYLLGILNAAAPVCGGINLEYYFSRVDNHKLGAGSKLPHNVMGLIGVANGIEGDLRPGLPQQMIEIHDPLRLLIVVEQKPEVVLKTIRLVAATYEWFKHEWIHLVVIDPETGRVFRFLDEKFEPYQTVSSGIASVSDYAAMIESTAENLPVFTLKNQLV